MKAKVQFSIHKGESVAHAIRIKEILKSFTANDFETHVVSSISVKNYFNSPNIHFHDSGQNYSFGAIYNLKDPQKLFINHAKKENEIYRSLQPDVLIGDTGLIAHCYEPNGIFYKILNRFYLEVGDKCYSPFSGNQKMIIRNDVESLVNNAREYLGYNRDFLYENFCEQNVIVNGAYNFIEDISDDRYIFAGINAKLKTQKNQSIRNKNVCFVALGTGDNGDKGQCLQIVLEKSLKHFSKIYVSIGEIKSHVGLLSNSKIIAKESYSELPDDVGVLIIHGGYGVSHLSLQSGIPTVLIPQHIEQYSNSFLLERISIGKSIGYIPEDEFRGLYQKIILIYDKLDEYISWAKDNCDVKCKIKSYNADKNIVRFADIIREIIC